MKNVCHLAFACLFLLVSTACAVQTPSARYAKFVIGECDRIERELPRIVRVAEHMAELYEQGAAIHFPWNGHGLQQELAGRAGGLMYLVDASKGQKPEGSDVPDMAIIGWDGAPGGSDLKQLKALDAQGCYIIGFGPATHPKLAEHVKLCDEMFDTGFGKHDHAIQLDKKTRVGKSNHVINALSAWTLVGEMVGAMTRRGQMPKMWKAYLYPDGRDWAAKYYNKGTRFHEDMAIEPIPATQLGKAYIHRIRKLTQEFLRTQQTSVGQAADLIGAEFAAGRKTIAATSGHMPFTFVGKYDDAVWARPIDLHESLPSQVKPYRETMPRDALVLRLGYFGMHPDGPPLFREMNHRVIAIVAEHPDEDHQLPDDLLAVIQMGSKYGDACVSIAGYPIKILPPSGIMQAVAYEQVNVEVHARLYRAKTIE
ncbi:MAG: hypothetical protein CMJ49_04295 [Planctomycetaceae bacterium]|nr:hypothetical protein [Planctomycetaceae bacterium]